MDANANQMINFASRIADSLEHLVTHDMPEPAFEGDLLSSEERARYTPAQAADLEKRRIQWDKDHGKVESPHTKMLDSHRDDCPVCTPRRALVMKAAADKQQAIAARTAADAALKERERAERELAHAKQAQADAGKVNVYNQPPPKPVEEEEPEVDPRKPVEVGF